MEFEPSFWRVQAPKFEDKQFPSCQTQSPKPQGFPWDTAFTSQIFIKSRGFPCFFFLRCNKIRWRLFEIFFQKGKKCTSVPFRDWGFMFFLCRFDFFVTLQVQEVCFWWFLVDWKVNHFIPQSFVQNHVNLRLLWMFLMPDLLISSFFSEWFEKSNVPSPAAGWNNYKNGHKN